MLFKGRNGTVFTFVKAPNWDLDLFLRSISCKIKYVPLLLIHLGFFIQFDILLIIFIKFKVFTVVMTIRAHCSFPVSFKAAFKLIA